MNNYYDDYEVCTCTTKIKEEKDGYYAFEDTIFYGEKGGMLADQGTINQLPVIDLKWEGEDLYHKVAGTLCDPIEMCVDEETRRINTTVQSVLHLLDGYYEKQGLSIPSVGVQPDNQWYEVNSKTISEEDLKQTEAFINEVIRQDINMTITYMNGKDYPDPFYQKFEELRVVSFGDINTQPCGTLHVNHTGQLESFVILDHEKTAKGTKVYFSVYHATNQKLKEYYRLVKEAAKAAGVKKEELCARIEELSKSTKQMKKELAEVKKQLIAVKVQELLQKEAAVIAYDGEDANDIRTAAQAMMNQVEGNKVIYMASGDAIHFAIVSGKNEARTILEAIKASFDVTGGGSFKIVTAKAEVGKDAFLEALAKIVS